jgi:hypothetical protein
LFAVRRHSGTVNTLPMTTMLVSNTDSPHADAMCGSM